MSNSIIFVNSRERHTFMMDVRMHSINNESKNVICLSYISLFYSYISTKYVYFIYEIKEMSNYLAIYSCNAIKYRLPTYYSLLFRFIIFHSTRYLFFYCYACSSTTLILRFIFINNYFIVFHFDWTNKSYFRNFINVFASIFREFNLK